MSQAERPGTKNKKLGLKKRNTLDLSVFSPNTIKNKPEKLQMRTLFSQCKNWRNFHYKKNPILSSYLKIFKKISWNFNDSLKVRIIHKFDRSTKLTKTSRKTLILFKLKLPASNIIWLFPNKKVSKIKINHSNRLKSYREWKRKIWKSYQFMVC